MSCEVQRDIFTVVLKAKIQFDLWCGKLPKKKAAKLGWTELEDPAIVFALLEPGTMYIFFFPDDVYFLLLGSCSL